jgi:hypothetical protein
MTITIQSKPKTRRRFRRFSLVLGRSATFPAYKQLEKLKAFREAIEGKRRVLCMTPNGWALYSIFGHVTAKRTRSCWQSKRRQWSGLKDLVSRKAETL